MSGQGHQRITSFALSYHPEHAYPITSHMQGPPTLQNKWIARKFQARTEPFWWSCIAKKDIGTMKSTIRSWLARRVRHAFVRSLNKEGIASDGTSLDSKEKVILSGSAQIIIRASAVKVSYTDLVRQTDVGVEKILLAQEKSTKARRVNTP
jgi:hypothetical protein